jgi:hypothetical protein
MNIRERKFVLKMFREVPNIQVFVAAGAALRDKMERQGLIGPNQSISPTNEEVQEYISSLSLRQLKALRELAESMVGEVITEEEYQQEVQALEIGIQ